MTLDGLRHGYYFVALLRDRLMRRGVPLDAATHAAQTMLDPWWDAIGERRERNAVCRAVWSKHVRACDYYEPCGLCAERPDLPTRPRCGWCAGLGYTLRNDVRVTLEPGALETLSAMTGDES